MNFNFKTILVAATIFLSISQNVPAQENYDEKKAMGIKDLRCIGITLAANKASSIDSLSGLKNDKEFIDVASKVEDYHTKHLRDDQTTLEKCTKEVLGKALESIRTEEVDKMVSTVFKNVKKGEALHEEIIIFRMKKYFSNRYKEVGCNVN